MKIDELIYRKYKTLELPVKMRRSKKTIFWRHHKIFVIYRGQIVIGWYGKSFPKTAQEIIDEVE